MRLTLTTALIAAVATPALAAGPAPIAPPPTAPPAAVRAYDLAPWWMDKPVMPAVGYVTTEVPANRASLAATYQAVDREVAGATKAAAAKARAISSALTAYGPEKVRIETTFTITPLYEQYRDKQGAMVDNERADKIDRYQVSVQFDVEIRDVRLVEPVYAVLMSAKPSQSQPPSFSLETPDEVRTAMFRLAIEDARRRADLAATAAGGRIGAVRLIDATARACETDVLLALAPRGYNDAVARPVMAPPMAARGNSTIEEMVVTSQKRAHDAGLRPEDLQLPVQPPLERLEAKACVVYSLG